MGGAAGRLSLVVAVAGGSFGAAGFTVKNDGTEYRSQRDAADHVIVADIVHQQLRVHL